MEDIFGIIIMVGVIAYLKKDVIIAKFKEFKDKK